MREFKFRAITRHGKLEYSHDLYFFEEEGIHENSTHTPVMQYTGLKDKNGKEIYEGDIVLRHPWPDDTIQEIHGKAVIIWNSGNFADGDLNPNGFYCMYGLKSSTNFLDENSYGKASMLNPEYVEITGNVIENPELLKV